MLACLDVSYSDTGATAACVLFRDWLDSAPARELTRTFPPADAYEPGNFYRAGRRSSSPRPDCRRTRQRNTSPP